MSKRSIRVEVDEQLHAQVKIKSALTGKTVADYCREMLTKWVDEEKPIVLPPKKDAQPKN